MDWKIVKTLEIFGYNGEYQNYTGKSNYIL